MLLCFSLTPLLSPRLVKEMLYISLKIFSSVLFQTFSLVTLVRISWWVCSFSYVLVSKLTISLEENHLCIHLSFISTLQNVSAFSIFILLYWIYWAILLNRVILLYFIQLFIYVVILFKLKLKWNVSQYFRKTRCKVYCKTLLHVLYSRFIGRLLAENTGSWGGDQRGSSSHSSPLGVRLHHSGYRLGRAEGAANGACYKAISQNNPWI